MMLVTEETLTSLDTMMVMICMRGSIGITTMLQLSDQQGLLIDKESPQEFHLGCLVKTSDQ